MTRHKFQVLRDRYLTDPAEQALVREMSRASRVVSALAELLDFACETTPEARTPDNDVRPAQPRIAQDDSLFLATLKDGIEELGGRLEVVAVFPDRRVSLLE